MNANELIAELKERHLQGCIYQEAADMLRQQQEKLTKYELRHAEQRKRIEELETKTLTDEEITELANEYLCYILQDYETTNVYEFARAILRKAQER